MIQALLITAYKDFDQLYELVNSLNHKYQFYIHIDKKSLYTQEQINLLEKHKQVQYATRNFNVNWGGINHLKSILHLAEEALLNKDIEYFHIVTGQDYPISSPNNIEDLLEKNKGKEYFEIFTLPDQRKHGWPGNGGLDRIEYYNFYDFFNAQSKIGNYSIKLLVLIQKLLGIKRSLKSLPKLYGGSTYCTLSYNALNYIINYTNQYPKFLKRFRYTFCAEESYFHTIIMNSSYKANVVNNNLRYIDWNIRNGIRPAILNEGDYHNIVNSGNIFARKLDSKISKALLLLLVNNNEEKPHK